MRGTPSARTIVRLLAACAVLVGVLFMHTSPAQTCSGDSMPVMTGMATQGDHLAAVPIADHNMGAGHGGVCMPTTPPNGLDGLLVLLLLAIAAVGVFAWLLNLPRHQSRYDHRPLPRAGPNLLTALCVFRT